jgi:predicted membrane protein (TIGR00267 family)
MEFLNRFRSYIHVSGVGPISRRYFVMNAFDGAMTILGIVIGTYIAGITEPVIVITAGLSTTLAMGISGFTGTYLVEESERALTLKKLERAMLRKLGGTLIGRSHAFASVWAAFIDGVSPAISAGVALIPFFLAQFGLIPVALSTISSIGITLVVLFLLGMFLGTISKRNLFLNGLKLMAAGLVLTAILFFLKMLG